MKKINRKRLNNKGFTLIELLAVVIILAVVMGIAMTSVLSTMNKSRAGSLSDSAIVVANGFNQQYTASMIDNSQAKLYGVEGYNFSGDITVNLVESLANEFNISSSTYAMENSVAIPEAVDGKINIKSSFVNFDSATGKFVVCLVAKDTGNNYVAANASDGSKSVTLDGNTYVFADGVMAACSNGTKTW